MSIFHTLNCFSEHALTGIQSQQRDWSPYLVHFTKWSAMEKFRTLFDQSGPSSGLCVPELPKYVRQLIDEADRESFKTFCDIVNSGSIRASIPRGKPEGSTCVCLAECNLPGLISHSERYGRFGFVFEKSDIVPSPVMARPCLYVDREVYGLFTKMHPEDEACRSELERVLLLANVYACPGMGQIQDYTQEREWRTPDSLSLRYLKAVICPQKYHECVSKALVAWACREKLDDENETENTPPPSPLSIPIIPIDMLFQWGA